jgi:hypothetical protein
MRRSVAILFALATLASPLAAQTHPDFSGKWVLDPKSVGGGMGPTSMTLDVTQDAKTVKVDAAATSQMGDQKSTTVINLDGSPSKNSVSGPAGNLELTSTGKWDGEKFIVSTKGDVQGQQVSFTETWSLESGGKVLHLDREIMAGGQTFTLKLVFNKQ